MMIRKSVLLALAATLAFAPGIVSAAPAAYVNSPMSTPQELVNTAITNVNTNLAPTGSGTVAAAINIPTVASAVNQLNIAPAATGSPPVLSAGGPSADTNVGIAINGNGTGSVYLGGSTAANAAASVAHGSANVNQIILTGTNTGTAPSITVGGSGADANRNLNISGIGTGLVALGTLAAPVSGATPQTANGQRGVVTTNSLTTAAATAATYVINNSSVTTASICHVSILDYSGTWVTNGYPIVGEAVPGSGTITLTIVNTHSANALSGTLALGFTCSN